MITPQDVQQASTAVEQARLAGRMFEEMLEVETVPARREKLQELVEKYKYLWLKLMVQ